MRGKEIANAHQELKQLIRNKTPKKKKKKKLN